MVLPDTALFNNLKRFLSASVVASFFHSVLNSIYGVIQVLCLNSIILCTFVNIKPFDK